MTALEWALALLALTALVVAYVVARAGWWWCRACHHRRFEGERSRGHLKLRRRMAQLAGRLKDEYDTVVRAETMPGWVWIAATRRPREPFAEAMGWSATRWGARRRLSRYRAERQPVGSPRR